MALSYQEQFFAGVDLVAILDRENYSGSQVISWKEYLMDSTSGKHAEVYEKFMPVLRDFALRVIERHDPIHDIGRRCHVLSDQFNRIIRKQFGDNPFWLFSTVGEIKYKGESVYDVTEEKVIRTYQRGFRPDEALDVHVWLTCEDMTIIDLTIMASLLRLGWVSREQYDENPVVFGKAATLGDFKYFPFLVDNDFVRKVDRG